MTDLIDEQSVLKQAKMTRVVKCSGICSLCCFLIGIIIPLILYYSIGIIVNQQQKLLPSSYEEWGQVPGSTGTEVIRNFTFFNFSNPLQVLFLNATPTFIETGPYSYQQYEQYVNATYSSDGQIVNFSDWVYFQPIMNTTGIQTVNALNIGGLGAWYQMKTANSSLVFLQGFSTLVMTVTKEIQLVLATYGITAMAFNNSAFQDLCLQAGVNIQQANLLWNDPLFGMGNRPNILWWVTVGKYQGQIGFANILQDYFLLTDQQFSYFVNFYSKWYETVWLSSIKDAYCLDDSVPCDELNIFNLQWTNQIITLYPPLTSIAPFPSITYTNITLVGYPEISYWFSQVFMVNNPNASLYSNVTFSPDWGYQVTWFSRVPGQFNKNSSSLLNLGNLNFLFETGEAYDATLNSLYLVSIQERFLLNTTAQAYVFWEYCQYFVNGFAVQEQVNGTVGIVSMANFVGPALAAAFWNTYYYLMPALQNNLIYQNLTVDMSIQGCYQFFSIQIPDILPTQVSSLCQSPFLSTWNISVIDPLTSVCLLGQSPLRTQMEILGITKIQILQMCTPEIPNSYGAIVLGAQNYLFQHYNCSSQNGVNFCTRYELTLRQWSSSAITLNPPPMLLNLFPQSTSVISWNSSISLYPWEFYNISLTLQALGVYPYPPQTFTINETLMLLNYQSLFSETILQAILINEKNGNWSYISQTYNFQYPIQLTTYIRYFLIYNVFGGFSQTRTVNQLLFGYTDPFLNYLKTMNPQQGGNPTYQSYLLINTPNSTYQQSINYPMSLHTGIANPDVSNVYASINNQNFINYNYSWFNGTDVFVENVSPWAKNITLEGTNGFVNPSNLNKNQVLITYNEAIFRIVPMQTTGSSSNQNIHNFNCYQYTIERNFLENITNNPSNAPYYNDVYNGFVNLTSVYDAELFVSQGHLLDADSFLQSNIIYLNSQGQQIKANPADDSYLYIEPITGITFSAYVNAQINELMTQDDLFLLNYTSSMLPIANIFVSANLSSDAVSLLLGPLKSAMLTGYIILGVGIGLGSVFLIVFGMALYTRNKYRNQSKFQHSQKKESSNQEQIPVEYLLEQSLNS